MKSCRRLAWALGLSAAIHAMVVAWGPGWAILEEPEDPATGPIEAILAPAAIPEAKVSPQARPPAPARPRLRPRPRPAPPPRAVEVEPPPAPAPAPEPQLVPQQETVAVPEPAVPLAAVQPVMPPVAPVPEPLPVPARARMEFMLLKGADGFRIGRAVLRWGSDGERYAMSSLTEATGIVSLFISGELRLESQGDLIRDGLRPRVFWVQRGDAEKTEIVHFNWGEGTAWITSHQGTRMEQVEPGSQDQLSVLFQFPFVQASQDAFEFNVVTGRKIDRYRYRIVGEEELNTELGVYRTLHVRRHDAEGRRGVEAWLALDHFYLPLKIRLIEKDGGILDQVVTGMSVER